MKKIVLLLLVVVGAVSFLVVNMNPAMEEQNTIQVSKKEKSALKELRDELASLHPREGVSPVINEGDSLESDRLSALKELRDELASLHPREGVSPVINEGDSLESDGLSALKELRDELAEMHKKSCL